MRASQSSESVERLRKRLRASQSLVSVSESVPTPTYVRTYGLTDNLQDSGDYLASQNARAHTAIMDSWWLGQTITPKPDPHAFVIITGV